MTYAEKVWREMWIHDNPEAQGRGNWAIPGPVSIISAALEERYRAGVEAMRDAAMREFGDVPKRLLDEADTIWEVAARLLEEKP